LELCGERRWVKIAAGDALAAGEQHLRQGAHPDAADAHEVGMALAFTICHVDVRTYAGAARRARSASPRATTWASRGPQAGWREMLSSNPMAAMLNISDEPP